MAFVGIDSDATVRYTSPNDPDKKNPSTFILGTISKRVQVGLKDKAATFGVELDSEGRATDVAARAQPNFLALETVRHGLRGWENFVDRNGNEIEFKTVEVQVNGVKTLVVAEECLQRLPITLIRELANEIEKLNDVSQEERKNSDG